MWNIADDTVDFDEAIAAFRKLVPMTRDEWDAMASAAAQKAFTVSGVAQLDVVAEVWDAVDDAIANGTTLEDFKIAIGEKLETAWAGTVENPGWRLETIFRTNLQRSYSVGRYQQATDPETLADRPYWLFDAIMDDATTPVCEAANGTIRPADDSWWNDHVAPLHFNCRSTMITLTEAEAAAMGGVTDKPTRIQADDGFGAAPSDDEADEWRPAAADYPDELQPFFRKVAG